MRIESETDLAEAVKGANGPLRIKGGGTRDVGAPVVGEVLEVGIVGVTLYEPGALTLVVGAGTPLAEIEALLEAEGQRLAFEPMDHRVLLGTSGVPTIGGAVAANVSGPRRIQSGAARDFTMGARFVDGAGRIVKNGGRVMKNVTGYDLVKLMAGSWGTLGVLSEVSLKVQARPEVQASLVAEGLSSAQAVGKLSAALGSPFDVTAAAHLVGGRTQVRLEGLAGAVAYRTKALQNGALAGFELVEGAASAALWAEVRDVAPFAGTDAAVWKVSVKPGDAPRLLDALGARVSDAILDWGGGLMWLAVPEAGDCGAEVLRGEIARLGGHATLVRARAETRAAVPVFQPEPAPIAALNRQIKTKFDPRGILNPGLMGV
ncbi:FAD-binding protein [Maritimibacter alexandrii]|uniref:FAD-binding protein n=1 Tax=Maritimibacter alexandrii TaxID=2570355 RepID=UPI0014872C22|nr:FAD-binding protein [Maritimibacter alexandrii]